MLNNDRFSKPCKLLLEYNNPIEEGRPTSEAISRRLECQATKSVPPVRSIALEWGCGQRGRRHASRELFLIHQRGVSAQIHSICCGAIHQGDVGAVRHPAGHCDGLGRSNHRLERPRGAERG